LIEKLSGITWGKGSNRSVWRVKFALVSLVNIFGYRFKTGFVALLEKIVSLISPMLPDL
jgi:hypothetical protein